MDFMDQILNQVRDNLVCPICKSRYEADRLKLRGFIDNTYIFQGYCANSHEPTVITYMASLHRLEKPIGTYFHTLSGEKITMEIAEQAQARIDSFKGNFSELWTS